MVRGVCLTLEPGTRIPNWIRNQTLNVKIGNKRHAISGRRLRFLEIKKGEASFCPGGGAEVKMPGSGNFWVAFQPLRVLEIADFEDGNMKRNYFMCAKCGTLTGKIVSEKPSTVAGRSDVVVRCTGCGFDWRLGSI